MSVTDVLIDKVRALPREDQQKVLDFVESLRPVGPRKDPCGLYAHLGIHISAEDIDAARREAWSNFPREFPEDSSP